MKINKLLFTLALTINISLNAAAAAKGDDYAPNDEYIAVDLGLSEKDSLIKAVLEKNNDAVKSLLMLNPSLANTTIGDIQEPLLSCAVFLNLFEITQALLTAQANPNAANQFKVTPLMRAVSNTPYVDNKAVIALLLASGASTEPCNSIGWSVLDLAHHNIRKLEVDKPLYKKADFSIKLDHCTQVLRALEAAASREWSKKSFVSKIGSMFS